MPALLFLRGEKKEINVVEAAAFACPSFSDEPSTASSPADRRWTSPSGGVGSKQRRNSPGRGLCFSMDAEGNSPCPWWRRRRWHVVFAAGAQWFLRNLSASLAQSPCSCMSSPGNLDRSVVVTWFFARVAYGLYGFGVLDPCRTWRATCRGRYRSATYIQNRNPLSLGKSRENLFKTQIFWPTIREMRLVWGL